MRALQISYRIAGVEPAFSSFSGASFEVFMWILRQARDVLEMIGVVVQAISCVEPGCDGCLSDLPLQSGVRWSISVFQQPVRKQPLTGFSFFFFWSYMHQFVSLAENLSATEMELFSFFLT